MEEVAGLKRKLEKYKSREWMAAGDEVLLEEIKMYKVRMLLQLVGQEFITSLYVGQVELSMLQCSKERHSSYQMFPCLLLRMHKESL